jgi:hypothetical protein
LSGIITNVFSHITGIINIQLIQLIIYTITTLATQGCTSGRKEPRVAGLIGMSIEGRVSDSVNISVLELSSITGVILLSVNGSKEPIWLDSISSVLLFVLSDAARGAVPSPTITAKANAPNKNSILKLKPHLRFILLNHESFILPPPWLL